MQSSWVCNPRHRAEAAGCKPAGTGLQTRRDWVANPQGLEDANPQRLERYEKGTGKPVPLTLYGELVLEFDCLVTELECHDAILTVCHVDLAVVERDVVG